MEILKHEYECRLYNAAVYCIVPFHSILLYIYLHNFQMYFHTFTRIKDIKDKAKKIFFLFPISSIKKKKFKNKKKK